MAIKIKKGESYLYRSSDGVLNNPSKIRADHIYKDAVSELSKLIYKDNDALDTWFKRGLVANKLIAKHNIDYEEKKFFWVMLYDAADLAPKKTSSSRNDFRTASVLASYNLIDLRKVGSWGLWREVIGAGSISNDERVAKWVTEKVIKEKLSRDGARPLIKYVINRLKSLDTSVLTINELYDKLEERL